MRLRKIICYFMACVFLFSSCYSEHLISVNDLRIYEKPKFLRISMNSGEVIEYKSDEIIMSKLSNNKLHLYFGDGTTMAFNVEEIQNIKIQIEEVKRNRTIYTAIGITLAVGLVVLFIAALFQLSMDVGGG